MAHPRRQAAVKTADKLHGFLMNPKSRPDLQTPEGQAFLRRLEKLYHERDPNVDPLLPWLTREWKKGRVFMPPNPNDVPGDTLLTDMYPELRNPEADRRHLPNDLYLRYNDPEGLWHQLHHTALSHWADFYHSTHPVRRQLGDIMKRHVGDYAQHVSDWDRAMEESAQQQMLQDGQIVHTTPDGWTVRHLTTPEELKAEGASMGHCVGNGGYDQRVDAGQSMIYSLRDPQGRPHVTTEIRPTRHADPGDWLNYLGKVDDLVIRTPTAQEGVRRYVNYMRERERRMAEGDRSMLKIPADLLGWQGVAYEAERKIQRQFPGDPILQGGHVYQIQGRANQEPIDEYKARMADWFRSFPPEDRPTRDADEEPYLRDDDGYGHSRLDHPDLIPIHERELGGLTPQPEGVEDEYGLIRNTGGMLPSDYDDLLRNIKFHDYGSQGGSPPDSTHIEDIYRLARERGEIPDLADALQGYQEAQDDDFQNWLDQNYEYAPHYPDEPSGWEDEDEEEADEGDKGARPYWKIRSGTDPYNDKYYSQEEAEKAYEDEYADWERQHPGMNAVSQMYTLVSPHWHPENWAMTEHGPKSSGYRNEIYDSSMGQLTPEQLDAYERGEWPPPQAPQQPGTVAKIAMPIIPTNWDALRRPRAEYVGDFPSFPGDPEQRAYRSPEYSAWLEAARPEIEAHRQREVDWDRAARNAMATGRMTPEQVTELGYRPTGHEGDGGWGAPKWGKWEPLPQRLYHVTTNIPGIATSGVLRSPYELDLDGKGRGLGGGTQDTISLTDSPEEAENIRRAMLEGADVASGRLPIERLVEMAANGEGATKPWLKTIFGNYDWSKGNPQALDDLLLGRKPFYQHLLPEDHPLREPASGLGGVRSAEEWAQHGYHPYPDAYALGQPGQPMYNERSVYRNLTPEEKAHAAFEWWRNPWAPMRSWSGGPSDPMFTGVDPHWFAKLDPSHVGIIETQPVSGAHGYPMSSLGEWRIPTGEAVNVTAINGQPYTPPVTGRTAGDGDGYVTCDQGHQHWGRNGAAGALLRHVDPQGQERYLLTLRSPEVHEGDCWGIPGGALDRHEQPHEAALRETQEELGTLPQVSNLRTLHRNDHGGWAYTTVTGDVAEPFQPDVSGWETSDAGWFAPHEVDQLPLHSGFAQTWQQLGGSRQSKIALVNAQPLYKRWVYSPASGEVTLADNSGDPLAVKYHTDLARERNEPNLVHGTAVRIGGGWRILDWEHKPLTDPHIIAQVMGALRSSNGVSGARTASWDPSLDDASWDRVHHGLPS